jgi:anti-sigma-K factor RskA
VSSRLDGPGAGHTEELEELAAGSALGALEAADEARFRAHLPTCGRCAALLTEYRAVVATLPEALAPIEASPDLRGRILAAAEADLARDERPQPGRLPEVSAAREPRAATPPRRLSPWALPLAALFAVTVGLGYWNYRLQEQVQTEAAALQLQEQALAAIAAGGRHWELAGTDQAPRAAGVLVQAPDDPRPVLLVRNLPDLPPEQTYQAWVIRGGTPADAGLLGPTERGVRVARLERPLDGAETVALTIEPRGGSRAPTGRIVLAGNIY